MKRKLFSLLLAVVMLCLCCAPAMAAGLENFKVVADYRAGQFSDVGDDAWYASVVATACRIGLMNGISKTQFGAEGNLTIAQTVTLAVRLHSTYHTGECTVTNGTPWYQPYMDYAAEHGLITQNYVDVDRPATRAEFAVILGRAFPDGALTAINDIDDGAIPDVPMTRSYAASVYRLYRAGILTGSDKKGSFLPDNSIRRSEVAAIVARMADVTQRKELTLQNDASLDAVAIARKCSPAVFFIEIFDDDGESLQTGSGFFISSSGLAVTNYHVISGGSSATVLLTDGTVHKVLGIYDYDEYNDIALLQVEGSGFPVLELSTEPVLAGQTVYAIGSPQGFDNTISQGIISNPARQVYGIDYIQFTAPISSGSSGGAVINDRGKVIGISSAVYTGSETSTAQNLNLAIPVSLLATLDRSAYEPLTQPSGDGSGSLYIENALYQAIGVGSEGCIPVFYAPSDGFQICWSFLYDSGDYVSVDWGDYQEGDWIPLYVTGLQPGVAMLEIDLWNADETALWDVQLISIEVVDAEITVSDTEPVLYQGVPDVLTFYADVGDYDATYYLTYDPEDPSMLSCEWDEYWDGDAIDLYVIGMRPGSTRLYVELYDDYENFLVGGWIPITIY